MVNGQVIVTCFYYPNLKVKQTSECYLGASAAQSRGKCLARGLVGQDVGGGARELPVIGELPRQGYTAWPAACSFTPSMGPSLKPRDSSV